LTGKKSVVRVTILGDEYSIRSDASPERTRAVAEHVDNVIKQTMRAGNIVEAQKAAILAALSITDELFDAREAG
jgi:cell division protein ZapA